MTGPAHEDHDLSQAERIDQLCTAFEASWKKGEAPRLEDRLDHVPVAHRMALLKELLVVESLGSSRIAHRQLRQPLTEGDLLAILRAAEQLPHLHAQPNRHAGARQVRQLALIPAVHRF